MEWFLLLIPVVMLLVLRLFFAKHIAFWEYALPIVIGILTIVISKGISTHSSTRDIEYLSHYVIKAQFFEAWDEYIHQTCESCTTDSDGNEDCYTYDCSYVDHHSEYWEITTNSGYKLKITEADYKHLTIKFGNQSFVDMGRNYHSIDGDQYFTVYPNNFEKLEYIVTKNKYENRVQASHDVFNFPDLTDEEITLHKLFNYPPINHKRQRIILGVDDPILNEYANKLNSLIGFKKEVRPFFLVFKNTSREVAHFQRIYWKGGNKNEFVICIGINDSSQVQWCEPFTWSESTMCNVLIRDSIQAMDSFDLKSTIDYSMAVLESGFKRKEFAEFSYIRIPMTSKQLWISGIIMFLVSMGVAIFVIKNDIDANHY